MENFPISVDIYGKSPWITVLQDVIYNHSYWFETVGYLFSPSNMITLKSWHPGFFSPNISRKDLWPKTVAPWILTHLKTKTSSVDPRRCKTSPNGLSYSRLRHRMVSNSTTCRPNLKRTTWRYFSRIVLSVCKGFRWKMFKRSQFPSGKWGPQLESWNPWKGILGSPMPKRSKIYTLRKTNSSHLKHWGP